MRAGDIIAGRFEIEYLAGEGGMGRVYRARERGTDTRVAIKVLHRGRPEDELRMAREARLLAELSHPSVVRYLGQGFTPSGEAFLVMEWLDGENLDQRLAHRGLSLGESLTMARHVAEALGAAHALGFIHRDVKPANVFLVVGSVDDIRVLDFGVARAVLSTEQPSGLVTRTGALVGTLGYMAPEQARGGAQIDASVDVFALGCILFECLTGRPAFTSAEAMAVLAKILFEQAPRVSDLRPGIPPVLDDLVARMLAKDPADRPRDARAVASELGRIRLTTEVRAQLPRARLLALTDSELRLVSVVVAARAQSQPAGAAAEGLAEGLAEDPAGGPAEGPAEALGGEARPSGRGNAAPSEVAAAVEPFGAQIERLPDGSMVATLRAKGNASEQAVWAARAALAMRELLPEAAIGLSTGRGASGGQLPLGEVIDRAMRLLTLGNAAPPGFPGPRARARSIYIDAITAGFLDTRFEVIQDAAGRFELGDERRAIHDTSRRLLGRPTPCVGRDHELEMLMTYLRESLQEPMAHALLVTAGPGTGKSRLGYEFLRRVRQEAPNVDIWDAQGSPMSAGSPLGMIGQLLRRVAGVHDGEPLETRRAKVRARIQRSIQDPGQGQGQDQDEKRARMTEFIGELAGVPFDDRESVQLRAARSNPQLMSDQLRRTWSDFIAAESAAHPVLIVLDDLHWGDLPSTQWLDSALRDLKERPVMVLALARIEVHDRFPRLWLDRGRQELRLGELSRKASERLARQVLGASVPVKTVERVVRQAGGNAFFLEELIRAVAEGKEDALPETVLAMMQGRLEELDPELRRIIRAASLFGESFWEGGLRALLGEERSRSSTGSSLDQLVDRELVGVRMESRFPSEREYRFRHAFVREAAYAMLTEHDRALGHRLAGEWLEWAGEQDALVLAGHFERGEEVAKAVIYYERSAEQALEVSDLGTAIERAERVVAAGAEGLQLGRARHIQAEALRWRNDLMAARERIEEAMRLLLRHGPAWVQALAEAVEIDFMIGDHRSALARFEALQGWAEGTPMLASQPIVFSTLAENLLRIGELTPALGLCRQLEWVLEGESGGNPLIAAWVRKTLGLRDAALGLPAVAHATFLLAQSDFQRAGDARQVEFMRLVVAMMATRLGRCDEAETALYEGELTMRRLGVHTLAVWARWGRAIALSTRGALPEALALLEEHLALLREGGNPSFLSKGLAHLAAIWLEMGHLDEAEAAAREGAEQEGHTPTAIATLAQVLLARGRPEEALPLARQAVDLRERMGLSVEEKDGLTPLVLAEALHATGDRAGAQDMIMVAREWLLAMAALLPDEDERSSLLAVPENARTLWLAEAWLGVHHEVPQEQGHSAY